MGNLRIQELRQLRDFLAALEKDADLMEELSLIDKDHIQGASRAVRSLFPAGETREMEETVNES